jgi:hypothetical protein
MSAGTNIPIPECPRCGYDLSGAVAAWKESCPLDGTCSECGLPFAWGDVLSTRFLGPNWSYEHAVRPSAARWLRTLWRSLLPWTLWSRLGLAHAIQLPRLAGLAFGAFLLVHVSAVVLAMYSYSVQDPAWWLARDLARQVLVRVIWPYGAEVWFGTVVLDPFLVPQLIAVLLPAALMPAGMLVLAQSFRMARMRRIHLLRGLCYSAPTCAIGIWVMTTAMYCLGLAEQLNLIPNDGATRDLILTGIVYSFAPWLAAWWWSFIGRYLQLRHSLAVAVLMTVVAYLGAVVALSTVALILGGLLGG